MTLQRPGRSVDPGVLGGDDPMTAREAPAAGAVRRIVALGASNLTRGLHMVVSTARRLRGPDVEILAALGHGRSYGATSRLLARSLPGILQSGIWSRLEALPPAPTRCLVTDVGNDILYGSPAAQTIGWVEETVDRLQRHSGDIVLTDLPMEGIRGLSNARFLFFRSLYVPGCRLSLSQVRDTTERVNDGLRQLAEARGLRLCRMKPAWYGFDPIHIRPSLWNMAWQEILCGGTIPGGAPASRLEAWRLYFLRPERRRLFGIEQVTPQAGTPLAAGGRLWLY